MGANAANAMWKACQRIRSAIKADIQPKIKYMRTVVQVADAMGIK